MRILMTGAAGWTASAIIHALHQAGHDIAGFDLPQARYRPEVAPLLSRMIAGDIADVDQVRSAVVRTAAEVILHLAVAVGDADYRSPDIPFSVNVKGAYNVFEAARRNEVRQVVLASAAAVHLPHEDTGHGRDPAAWTSSPGDDHLYDLTKRLQEEIARDFCQTFGLRVVVLRLGHIVDGRKGVDARGRDLATLAYCRGGWVCRYDVARACVQAVALAATGYAVFDVIGAAPARQRFDIDRTKRVLGLAFETRFEGYG